MNLNGKNLVAVKKFQQQRKLWPRMVTAENCRAPLDDEGMQCHTGERAFCDDALIVAVVDDLPAFGVVVAVLDGLAKLGAEAAAAPDLFPQDWRET